MAGKWKSENLIQTVIDGDLHVWVRQRAKEEGISVAAWVRRLIMKAFRDTGITDVSVR